jgi:hypothetical protein
LKDRGFKFLLIMGLISWDISKIVDLWLFPMAVLYIFNCLWWALRNLPYFLSISGMAHLTEQKLAILLLFVAGPLISLLPPFPSFVDHPPHLQLSLFSLKLWFHFMGFPFHWLIVLLIPSL